MEKITTLDALYEALEGLYEKLNLLDIALKHAEAHATQTLPAENEDIMVLLMMANHELTADQEELNKILKAALAMARGAGNNGSA